MQENGRPAIVKVTSRTLLAGDKKGASLAQVRSGRSATMLAPSAHVVSNIADTIFLYHTHGRPFSLLVRFGYRLLVT